MNPRAGEIVSELQKYRAQAVVDAARNHTHQSALTGELLVIIAEEQEQAAARMEQQTDRLVKQTDTLVRFTKGLYALTIALLLAAAIQIAAMFLIRP